MATTVRLSIGNRPAVGLTVVNVTQRAIQGHATGWDLLLTGAPPAAVVVTDKVVSNGSNFLIKEIAGNTLTVVGDAFFHQNAPVNGAATSSRSFENHYQVFTLCSNLDFRTFDWMYTAEYWREGTGPNGEWQFDRFSNGSHLAVLENCLGDDLRHLVIKPAPGHGFIDSFETNNYPLKYNPSLGVALKISGQFSKLFVTYQTVLKATGTGYLENYGLMIDGTGETVVDGGRQLGTASLKHIVNSCVITNGRIINTVEGVNLVVYSSGPSVSGSNSDIKFTNCTIVSTSFTGPMITPGNYMTAWFKNCAVFGFTALSSNPAKINLAQSYRLATDLQTDGTVGGITGSIYNLNVNNELISIASGSEDIQLKANSSLIGAGLPNASTLGLDVTGRPRSATNPSIGAAETTWYPLNPVAPQSDQTIAKGIARGIERGIV